jgi:HAD superfamily hydrolase (TIGR01509 family)
VIEAVVFDLDGVIFESEEAWDEVREEVTRKTGGRWHEGAHRDMMGMSSLEWSRYMRDQLGVPHPPEWISRVVVERLSERYQRVLPVIPGAPEAVARLAARWPLAVASSSNRELIDLVLELAGVAGHFRASVSSEEVERGKPAPDVFLAAAYRLGADPRRTAAIEDSHNGILAAHAAGMRVIAIPSEGYAPGLDAVAAADVVLGSVDDLRPEAVDPSGDGDAPATTPR